jgi:hypothetical protein
MLLVVVCDHVNSGNSDKTNVLCQGFVRLLNGFVRTKALRWQGLQPIPDKMTKQTQPFFKINFCGFAQKPTFGKPIVLLSG